MLRTETKEIAEIEPDDLVVISIRAEQRIERGLQFNENTRKNEMRYGYVKRPLSDVLNEIDARVAQMYNLHVEQFMLYAERGNNIDYLTRVLMGLMKNESNLIAPFVGLSVEDENSVYVRVSVTDQGVYGPESFIFNVKEWFSAFPARPSNFRSLLVVASEVDEGV